MDAPRRILLTGAGRGLGLVMTAGFIDAGHTVIGCSRNAQRIEAHRQRWPEPHTFDAVDVADESQVRAWAKRTLDHGGPPDLIVNNAAIINHSAPLWEVPSEEFDRVIDVNLRGVAHVIRHFLPAMIEAGRGIVVNLSSGWGRSVSPKVAPYCATKWAIEGLTRALAEEIPDGMAAIPLNPGIINTDILQRCLGESAACYPQPEAWAQAAVPFILNLSANDNGRPLTVPA